MPTWLGSAAVAVNLAGALFMTGLIWFVQIVHYPLYARVGEESFVEYERAHTRLTGLVVAPPMLLEAAGAVALLFSRPAGVTDWVVWSGFVLLAVIWVTTALVQVPCHQRLEEAFGTATHLRLVRSNWVRTVAWSARALLALWMTFNKGA
jgi:hypothetical protein